MSASSTTTRAEGLHAFQLSHPGTMLADEMDARGLSANALARALSVPPNRITAIVNGERGVTPDTALRLEAAWGTPARLWLDLQLQHDLAVTQRDHGEEIRRQVAA